jgi:hypothetical protein
MVLWDRATVVVRLGTMLIGVLGSRQIRLQLQAQIITSTAILTTAQPLQQGRTKLSAHMNHVVVEDAQAALDVIIGMILVDDNNAIVLFDSGASHSFVAANFVQKHNLPLFMLKNRMIVSSHGGDMHARHVSPKVSILIRG